MTSPRILVAGIGNIFLGDDAFGVEVVRQLAGRAWPEGVRVIDYGIRGFDLACALVDSDLTAILVDAMPRGEAPGTLYVLEPELAVDRASSAGEGLEPHGLDPVKMLRLVQALGGKPKRVLIVGCEPATLGEDEDGHMGLSEAVQAAVPKAGELIEALVQSMQDEAQLTPAASDALPA